MESKINLRLTKDFVNLCVDYFEEEYFVNFFSNRYVYFSQNFEDNIYKLYQMVGDLGAVAVNSWKEESIQTTVFIISDIDYENIETKKSKEVKYIENLINKKQTIKDVKQNIMSSDVLILPLSKVVNYCNLRNEGKIKTPFQFSNERTERTIKFKKQSFAKLFKTN